MKILVTGGAGFIGYHLCKLLASDSNNTVLAIDNLNEYYDVRLKLSRLKDLGISYNASKSGSFVSTNSIPGASLRLLDDVICILLGLFFFFLGSFRFLFGYEF